MLFVSKVHSMFCRNAYVGQISFDVQLQIQSVTWRFQIQKECPLTSTFPSKISPRCHMPSSTCDCNSEMSIDMRISSSQVTPHVKIWIMSVNRRAFCFCASFRVSNVKNLTQNKKKSNQKSCPKYTRLCRGVLFFWRISSPPPPAN